MASSTAISLRGEIGNADAAALFASSRLPL